MTKNMGQGIIGKLENERACNLSESDILTILGDRMGKMRAKDALTKCINMLKVLARSQPHMHDGVAASINLLELFNEYLDPTGKVKAIPADIVAKRVLIPRAGVQMAVPIPPEGTTNNHGRERPSIKFGKSGFEKIPPVALQPNEQHQRNDEIIARWNASTLSIVELASEFSVSKNTVNGVLWRNKERLTRSLNKAEPETPHEDKITKAKENIRKRQEAIIYRWNETQLTVAEIADEFQVSKGTVKGTLYTNKDKVTRIDPERQDRAHKGLPREKTFLYKCRLDIFANFEVEFTYKEVFGKFKYLAHVVGNCLGAMKSEGLIVGVVIPGSGSYRWVYTEEGLNERMSYLKGKGGSNGEAGPSEAPGGQGERTEQASQAGKEILGSGRTEDSAHT